MKKILYNIGCSYSEGNGIGEDKGLRPGSDESKKLEAKSRYSAILSDKLGLTEINEAKGGGSNQRIFRKTWNWIAKNPKLLSETLFVIQWSYPVRSEYYNPEIDDKKWNHVDYVNDKKWTDQKFGMNEYLGFKVPDVETSSDITLRYVLSLQSFFKEHKVNFIFFEGDDSMWEQESFQGKMRKSSINFTSNLGKLVDLDYWVLESFIPFSGKELTSNGHPNAKSQIKWAEKIENIIKEKNYEKSTIY